MATPALAEIKRPPVVFPGMVCIRYRPRQPRASPVWQILHDHADKQPALQPDATTAIQEFLNCGDLHAGFTRLHCPDCGHEFLLAFTCKGFRAARKPTRPALGCRPHRKPRRRHTGKDSCSTKIAPSLMPPMASRCFGPAAPSSMPRPRTSSRQRHRSRFENSPVDSESAGGRSPRIVIAATAARIPADAPSKPGELLSLRLGIFVNRLFGAQTSHTGLRHGGLQGSDSVSTRHPPLKPLPDPNPLKIRFPISSWRARSTANRRHPWRDASFADATIFRDLATGSYHVVIQAEGAEPVSIQAISVHAASDVAVREYEHGVILANPSHRQQSFAGRTLFPGVALRRLQATERQDSTVNNGAPVGDSVVLALKDALFLLKTSTAAADRR